ncbi:DUF4129 domain-containing protein [Nocardia sp. NPDC052254]|uniref:DUF4129 domain-containing protein n=1 Tax=Nocardia sp. NPDC052254 TaxID=3155681 RepID=UPI003448EB8D
MAGVRTAIPRAIGLIALMACVVFALRGYIPGTGGPHAVSPPSVVTVALMPVLSLVSVVILLAGVFTSQHRLPLAMPDDDHDRERQPFRLTRFGMVLLIAVAMAALLAAIVWAVYLLVGGPEESAPSNPASSATTGAQPTETRAPQRFSGTPELSGSTLILVAVGAGLLVAVAVIGLGVVAVGSRDRRGVPQLLPPPAATEPPVSLAQVAEMGLAAMMASGSKDARTAIIACYVAMESGLAQAREVAPLISDTPSEVLARAFDRGVLHDASARELVTLFEEARFSPHSILEWQRMRAEQLLRIVLADLQGARL